jgi:hypothetical protein
MKVSKIIFLLSAAALLGACGKNGDGSAPDADTQARLNQLNSLPSATSDVKVHFRSVKLANEIFFALGMPCYLKDGVVTCPPPPSGIDVVQGTGDIFPFLPPLPGEAISNMGPIIANLDIQTSFNADLPGAAACLEEAKKALASAASTTSLALDISGTAFYWPEPVVQGGGSTGSGSGSGGTAEPLASSADPGTVNSSMAGILLPTPVPPYPRPPYRILFTSVHLSSITSCVAH